MQNNKAIEPAAENIEKPQEKTTEGSKKAVFTGVSERIVAGKPVYVWSVWFCFLCAGFLYAQFTSRMPALSRHAGLDEADLGLLLMCFSVGSLTGLISSGFLLKRFQAATVIKVVMFVFCAGLSLISFMTHKTALMPAFALWGLSFALLDVCINTQAMYLESHTGKNYMAGTHANYSLGCVAGSGVSALFALAGIGITINYSSLALIMLALFLLFFRQNLLPDPKLKTEVADELKSKKRKFALVPFFVVFCGMVSFMSYMGEGSVAEWGAVVMVSAKDAPESLAAMSYAVLAGSMSVMRFFADRIRDRYPDQLIMLVFALIACLSMLMVIQVKDPLLCLLAYGIMGIGIAPLAPVCFSRAGSYEGVDPKTASTVIALVGYSGFLVFPPTLGYIGHLYGMEKALYLPFAALVLIVLLSFCFKRKKS